MTKLKFGRIAVLAGGRSREREISLRSGRAVHKALTDEGLEAIFVDVGSDIYDIIKSNKFDAAFIALHGKFGEDGTAQKILEKAGIPYTGSGPLASKLALDKIASKEVFINNSIATPRYIVFSEGMADIDSLGVLEMPVVVKPQFEGSSIGMSIINDKSELEGAVKKAYSYGDKVLLEEYIEGRELTVGILDDKPLPVIEIVTKEGVYDYTAKYKDPETKYIVPAKIDRELYNKAQDIGKRSHDALGCRSFSRVDMIMDGAGNIWTLEVNTIPGMTERSLLPKAALADGINFNKLCVRLLENAIKTKAAYETSKKF